MTLQGKWYAGEIWVLIEEMDAERVMDAKTLYHAFRIWYRKTNVGTALFGPGFLMGGVDGK